MELGQDQAPLSCITAENGIPPLGMDSHKRAHAPGIDPVTTARGPSVQSSPLSPTHFLAGLNTGLPPDLAHLLFFSFQCEINFRKDCFELVSNHINQLVSIMTMRLFSLRFIV